MISPNGSTTGLRYSLVTDVGHMQVEKSHHMNGYVTPTQIYSGHVCECYWNTRKGFARAERSDDLSYVSA